MKRVLRRHVRVGIVAFAAIVLGACGSSTPTNPPASTPAPTLAELATASPGPTLAPTGSPSVAHTATPTATATETATPGRTETPAPASSPTLVGSVCTATSKFQSLFSDAANDLSFDVYCPILPSDWWVQNAEYTLPNGGMLDIVYTNARGFNLEIIEGYPCGLSVDCSVMNPAVQMTHDGRIWLSDLGADLYSGVDKVAGGRMMYCAWSAQNTHLLYDMLGEGMSEKTFENLAKVVAKVPKP
jgi:hypothetical protein